MSMGLNALGLDALGLNDLGLNDQTSFIQLKRCTYLKKKKFIEAITLSTVNHGTRNEEREGGGKTGT